MAKSKATATEAPVEQAEVKPTLTNDEIVAEYEVRSKRKTADEKWLKEYRPIVLTSIMGGAAGKKQYGAYQISVTEPDKSFIDPELLKKLLIETGNHLKTLEVKFTPEEVADLITGILGLSVKGDMTPEKVWHEFHTRGEWTPNDAAAETLLAEDEDLMGRVTKECYIIKKDSPRLSISKKGKE